MRYNFLRKEVIFMKNKHIAKKIMIAALVVACIVVLKGTGKVYCATITAEQKAALAAQYHGTIDSSGTVWFYNFEDSAAYNDAVYHLEHPGQAIPEDHAPEYATPAAQQPANTTNASTDASKQTTNTQVASKEEKQTESLKKADTKQIEETTTVDNTPVKNEVTKKPTCTEDGERTYYNKNGDAVKTEKIAAIGHDYEKTVTKEPTCTDKGVTTYKCKNCGDTYTEDIPALGHQIDKGTVTKKAGMFTAGEKVYKCTRCGKIMKTEVIPSQYSMKVLYAIIAIAVAAVIVAAILVIVIHKKRHPLGI
jgi:DNA-directed RNA polymerase subunit RPC12/RpoP